MSNEIEGTEAVTDPAASRTVITDEDVVKSDDLTTATIGDADVHDPPVRSALPDSPVADAVGVGQGEHAPPDPAAFDREGRPLAESSTVKGPGGDGDEATGRVPDADDSPALPVPSNDDVATSLGGSSAAPESDGSTPDDDGGDGDEPNPVPGDVSGADPAALADEHSGDELEAAARERDVSHSGTKVEVAERLVGADKDA